MLFDCPNSLAYLHIFCWSDCLGELIIIIENKEILVYLRLPNSFLLKKWIKIFYMSKFASSHHTLIYWEFYKKWTRHHDVTRYLSVWFSTCERDRLRKIIAKLKYEKSSTFFFKVRKLSVKYCGYRDIFMQLIFFNFKYYLL